MKWWSDQGKAYAASFPTIIRERHSLSYYTDRLNQGIMSSEIAKVDSTAENQGQIISRIAREGIEAFDKAMSLDDFESQVRVAQYMESLREAIEPFMPAILKLRDSPMGFRTDRGKDSNKTPYDEATVKECVVEALLRGVKLVGDQFNIIASRTYITLNGYRLLVNGSGCQQLTYDVQPIELNEKEHKIQGKASWVLDGKTYSIEKQFSCKAHISKGGFPITTWEQTQGKATRKLFKAIYETVTGRAFHEPDEDVREDAIEVEGAVVDEPSAIDGRKQADDSEALIKELTYRLGESEIHPEHFVKFICDSPKINVKANTVRDLVTQDHQLASALLKAWRSSVERFKKSLKESESKGEAKK